MAFDGLSVGALPGVGWKGSPFWCEAIHCSFGQAIAINLRQCSTLPDEVQRCLVLVLRSKAWQVESESHFLPCGWQELISPCGCTGISLDDNTFGMAGEVLKLATSVKDSVAEIVTILPGAFGKANGIQQCATLRSNRVMRCGLVRDGRRADVLSRGVRGSLPLQGLGHDAVLLIAFAGALSLQALSKGKRKPHADSAKTDDFCRGLRNGLDPLGESMQQPR